MSVKEFNLPDPGEGLTEATIVTWKVKEGDEVRVNDIVVEVETAKSLVELPIPFAGRVEALLVPEGREVPVGTPIIAVDTAPGASEPPAALATSAVTAGEEIEEGKIGGTTSTGRTAVLVGYGVKQTEAKRRPRTQPAPAETAPTADIPPLGSRHQEKLNPVVVSPKAAVEAAVPAPVSTGVATTTGPRPLAKPPVRKLAKDLGVDLASVTGTGGEGIITREDVLASSSRAASVTATGPAYGTGVPAYGRGAGVQDRGETRTPVAGVRKVTAEAMVRSAFTAPHVTEWLTIDVTATMDLLERLKRDSEFRDLKVTPLLILAKAMCIAVRRHPAINASWDEASQEIVTKGYVNLGIAAATPRGLIVPNVKDADLLPLADLARAIADLTATAREGRTQPADMAGGTITITNVGVFGVDSGTPILNRGESAIMALGAVRRMPWVVTGSDGTESVEPRWVTQLAVSFDHRLVDGELGSRYLADVAAILSDPTRALVWG